MHSIIYINVGHYVYGLTLIVSYIIIIMPCYLNQYVTVYQVIFNVLNFRILPKF